MGYHGNRTEINLDRLTHNVREISKHISPKSRFMAVVKGDAYGHGLIPISQHLNSIGIRHFAVSNMDDAISLRKQGIQGQILHIGVVEDARIQELIDYEITPSICSVEFAMLLSNELNHLKKKIIVHIRMDQGLGTIGIPEGDCLDAVLTIHALPGIQVEALFTQIPGAYIDDHALVERSLERFRSISNQIKAAGIADLLLHAVSSPMVKNFPDAHFDMVRIGIILFGLKCIGSEDMDLKPVLNLKSHVVRVRELQVGERFGYGCTQNEDVDRLVATVQIGYGDALFLFSIHTGQVLIRGHRANILGRSTMDHLLIDVRSIPDVQIGDEVVLIGSQGSALISAEEVAEKAGFNEYNAECITMYGQNVTRFYLKGGISDAT